jgi:allantoate deiminase
MAKGRMTSTASTTAIESCSAERLAEAARRVMRRCDELADCTDRPGEITRLFCSPAMRAAHQRLRGWMPSAGLQCRLDPAGNLIGRLEPQAAVRSGEVPEATRAPAVLIGSHLDSVVRAGRYDGPLGVLLGLAATEIVATERIELPWAIEVIAFCEEEGVRYELPYFGSRALVGEIPTEWLARPDAEGIPLADALRSFGGDPDRLDQCVYRPEQVVAFIEPHIEQGPTLEERSLPVGVVSGIVGQTRASLRWIGRAGHAGTVPMASRRDALAGAAEWIVAVDALAAETPGLVATVGRVEVGPNVGNVIPGEVRLRLDLRHADDERRTAAYRQLIGRAEAIAARRRLELAIEWVQAEGRTEFCPASIEVLEQAVATCGVQPLRLASGAGHDALVMARHFPTAMLFVRCAGGVSHHPDEAVAEADVRLALDVLVRAVRILAATQTSGPAPAVASPNQS